MATFEPRVALINATKTDWEYLEPPLGLLSIATYLIYKRVINKKNLIILDVNLRDPLDLLRYFKPDIVGISSVTTAYPDAVEIGRKIKEKFDTPIIIGGVHISVCPDSLAQPFDIGVVGEGEQTLYELIKFFSQDKTLEKNKLKKIKGLIFRKENGSLRFTGIRTLIKPLDKIPSLDWSLLPEAYFRYELFKSDGEWHTLRQAPVFSARGCPFNCAFCSRHSVFMGVRFFSVQHTVDEIEDLVKNYGIEAIHLLDDTFTLSKERVREFIEEMKKRNLLGKVIFVRVFGRSDLVDEEFLKLFRELKVASITYGFESGSERVLSYLKENSVKVADNKKAAVLTDKYRIGISGAFMFGSPYETKEDMEKTLKFIKWLIKKETIVRLYISRTSPFPGTKLWDYALEKGIVSEGMDWSLLKTLTPEEESAPPLFFNENISFKDYEKAWKEARRLRFLVGMQKIEQKGASRAIEIFEKKSRENQAQVPLQLIKREVRSGRLHTAVMWFVDRFFCHLFSFRYLHQDLLRLKVLLSWA